MVAKEVCSGKHKHGKKEKGTTCGLLLLDYSMQTKKDQWSKVEEIGKGRSWKILCLRVFWLELMAHI